jgi:hypothetical protein
MFTWTIEKLNDQFYKEVVGADYELRFEDGSDARGKTVWEVSEWEWEETEGQWEKPGFPRKRLIGSRVFCFRTRAAARKFVNERKTFYRIDAGSGRWSKS